MNDVDLVVFLFFLSVMVTEIRHVPVLVAMTFVFATLQTLADVDFIATLLPDGTVSFMRFKTAA